ncbi:MAG: hypothetical protein RL757_2563 [Bacteroidota bacterium]|jgi:beta-lactam-binding protein with PASTA domain
MSQPSLWERIKTNVKNFATEAYYFLSSKIFLTDFGKMMLLTALFLTLTFWGMKCYTRHGEMMKVGDYVGKPINEALSRLKSQGFDYIITDSTYKPGLSADIIKTQDPAPNVNAKAGRTIYLSIYTREGRMVTLPDLAGNEDFKMYSMQLENLGVVSVVREKRTDAKYEDGTILQVFVEGKDVTFELKNGIAVKQASTVEFVVSQVSGDDTQVPDLACSNFEGVTLNLEAAGLKLGATTAESNVTDRGSAYIWKQEPAAATVVKKGTIVNVYLTAAKPAGCQ